MSIHIRKINLISKTILFELDLSVVHEGKEHELGLSIVYEYLPDFCQVEILQEVIRGDDSFLNDNEVLREQVDEFVNHYVTENINKI